MTCLMAWADNLVLTILWNICIVRIDAMSDVGTGCMAVMSDTDAVLKSFDTKSCGEYFTLVSETIPSWFFRWALRVFFHVLVAFFPYF